MKFVSKRIIIYKINSFNSYIAVREMSIALGPERSFVLPFVHGFTGYDVTSFFFGKGTKIFWDVWIAEDELEFTKCFTRLIENQTFEENDLQIIEKFVTIGTAK